jgi:hypothetical protein
MVNTSLTPAGLIVKKCRPSLRNYVTTPITIDSPGKHDQFEAGFSLHCPSGRRLRARKQRTKSLKGGCESRSLGARMAPSGRPAQSPHQRAFSLRPQGLGALEEAHVLWAKSDFPEQPPLYVKPLHLERAREPGVASAQAPPLSPAIVLVVPKCGPRPAASKIWLCRKVRLDAELEKGRRPERRACPL